MLLDALGHCCLADYGLARLSEGRKGASSDARKNSFAGTLEYMAPETLLKGDAALSRVFFFSFCTFLTGHF